MNGHFVDKGIAENIYKSVPISSLVQHCQTLLACLFVAVFRTTDRLDRRISGPNLRLGK